jgi:polysaccharide pyruvyl transferase WcaK-like protein
MLRILFCGGSGSGNIGDDSIFNGLLASARKYLPADTEFGVVSWSPEMTKVKVKIDKIWGNGEDEAFVWASHVVLGGATLISENPNIDFPLGYIVYIIKKTVQYGKPVCMLAVGASDVHSEQAKSLIRDYYDKYLGVITVRSEKDMDKAISLGINPNHISVCADASFSDTLVNRFIHPKNILGLNLVNEAFTSKYGHIPHITHSLSELKSSLGLSVKGLCSEVRPDAEYDSFILNKVVSESLKGIVYCDYVSPDRFGDELSECRVIVSMRMHILVFCAVLGVPCIPIIREAKTAMMAEELGIKEVLHLDTPPHDIKRIIRTVWENPSEYIVDKSKVLDLRERAFHNGKVLLDWINGRAICL